MRKGMFVDPVTARSNRGQASNTEQKRMIEERGKVMQEVGDLRDRLSKENRSMTSDEHKRLSELTERFELRAVQADPVEAETRRLLGDDHAAEDAERIAELRKREPALRRTVEIATEAVKAAERIAANELRTETVEARFRPRLESAARLFVGFVAIREGVQDGVRELQAAGFGVPMNPFAGRVPLEVGVSSGLREKLRGLIAAGVIDRETESDALPQVAKWGWLN